MLLAREYVEDAVVVARVRDYRSALGVHRRLDQVGARLGLAVPDYGVGGLRGLKRGVDLLTNRAIRRPLRVLIEQAEFIYADGGACPVAFLGAQIARQVGRHLILEMRGESVLNRHYMRQRYGLLGLAYLVVLRKLSETVHRQSLAGLYRNQDLLIKYPVAGNVRSVISGVHLPDGFGGVPRQYTEPARCYMFTGHLEAVKRVDLILNALNVARERLPREWCFHVVGGGPQEPMLRTLTEELRLGEHVVFHGRVQWGEPLAQLYRRADLALMASTTEGASRALVEAMAFGLPVVSTSVGNAPELLDSSVLVPAGNLQAYASLVTDLVNDPVRLTKYSKDNWERAQNFQPAVLDAKRREFWEQAIDLSRREVKKGSIQLTRF